MSEQELVNVVTLVDEDGKDVQFDHLLTFDYEGHRFIALMPMEEVEGIADDEVLLMTIEQDETGEDVYRPVENEVLLDEAFERFLDLMDELEDEEDGEEE